MSQENTFTDTWYSTFLSVIAPEVTELELAYLARVFPISRFPTILDLCCGEGRHALGLGARGYQVLGIDANAGAIERARAAGGEGTRFEVGDMRALPELNAQSGAICMWQSFGYFDVVENRQVLRGIRRVLAPRGRVVLDLYQRVAALQLPLVQTEERNGVEITTTRKWVGSRLISEIAYSDGSPEDRFEWNIYSQEEVRALAAECGFAVTTVSAWWDEKRTPTKDDVRVQYVLDAVGSDA